MAAFLVAVGAYAQGTVQFNNRVTTDGVDFRLFAPDGVTGAGAGYTADLLARPGASTSAADFKSVGTTSFRTSSAASQGYVTPIDVTVAGIAAGADADFIVRFYNGASYTASSIRGETKVIDDVTLGGVGSPPSLPVVLKGKTGSVASPVTATLIPEPSTIALAALGFGALLLRRRK